MEIKPIQSNELIYQAEYVHKKQAIDTDEEKEKQFANIIKKERERKDKKNNQKREKNKKEEKKKNSDSFFDISI